MELNVMASSTLLAGLVAVTGDVTGLEAAKASSSSHGGFYSIRYRKLLELAAVQEAVIVGVAHGAGLA